MSPAYHAPVWLPGAHLQTIYAAQIAPRAPVSYRRERWDTPDGDFIDIDFTDTENPTAPLLVLFHGLEGCSRSHYALALMSQARQQQWQGAVVHFRGCSGQINLAPRAYHSGDSAEVDWILRRFAARYPARPRYAIGVSLGANALLKWLGEQGESAAAIVYRCAAVSAPQDLQAGAQALAKGISRVYAWNFFRSLKRKSEAKLVQFPGLFDADRMRNANTFFEFDDAVTAPLHGFKSCYDYWERSSCKQYLGNITVPSLVLNARNDPFVPEQSLANTAQVSDQVQLCYPPNGGHVGFLRGPVPGSLQWLRDFLFAWLVAADPPSSTHLTPGKYG